MNDRLLIACLALSVAVVGCRRDDDGDGTMRQAVCREVCVAAQCICDSLGGVTNGLDVLKVDARKLDCNGFFNALADVPDGAILWMPGEYDWLVIWSRTGGKFSLADMLERFSAFDNDAELLRAGCDSVMALLASYAGTVGEVRPAFARLPPETRLVPELFVTREPPEFVFDTREVDPAVLSNVFKTATAYQRVRRKVLTGCMEARRGNAEAAVAAWCEAAAGHAEDTMLLERFDHLKKNGEVFYRLGRFALAAQCYETMSRIRPEDPVPIFNYGVCAERLGNHDLAEQAYDRAKELDK